MFFFVGKVSAAFALLFLPFFFRSGKRNNKQTKRGEEERPPATTSAATRVPIRQEERERKEERGESIWEEEEEEDGWGNKEGKKKTKDGQASTEKRTGRPHQNRKKRERKNAKYNKLKTKRVCLALLKMIVGAIGSGNV